MKADIIGNSLVMIPESETEQGVARRFIADLSEDAHLVLRMRYIGTKGKYVCIYIRQASNVMEE
jgi:hypothetical protein